MLLFLSFLILHLSIIVQCAPQDARIGRLPGVDFPVNFDQYSGYLDASDTNKLFYWFVESERNPAKDPLVLWLTGGPGCSSLSALFMENGPFFIYGAGEKLYPNPYAWNKVANIIFLESPAGVGFSYASDGNIWTNDNKTAEENYRALKHFLQLYPEFAQHEFFLTGESYAGFYVPTLASWIIRDPQINFKGLAIGNGFMSASAIYNSLPPFLYNHNLIPEELWSDVLTCCNDNPTECDYFSMMKNNKTSFCYNTTIAAISNYNDYGLDPYDIYFTCDNEAMPTMYGSGMSKSLLQRFTAVAPKAKARLMDTDPNLCPVYNRTALYLNRPDVQEALHVQSKWSVLWSMCNDDMNDTVYTSQYENMDKQFADIFELSNIRLLLYNGDTDTVCNSVANQRYARSLKRKQLEAMRPWVYEPTSPNVGGMLTRYDRLDYLTVRGAGHQVPSSKPGQSLQMLENFLKNKPYDTPLDL